MPVFSKQDILHGKYTYTKNQEMPTKKNYGNERLQTTFLKYDDYWLNFGMSVLEETGIKY